MGCGLWRRGRFGEWWVWRWLKAPNRASNTDSCTSRPVLELLNSGANGLQAEGHFVAIASEEAAMEPGIAPLEADAGHIRSDITELASLINVVDVEK